MYMFDNIIL